MADKSFGVKELNLLNASGTPTVTSPNNLNLNANTVAISTSCTIGSNLDVDGTTNLDNVDIVGITTIRNASGTKLYEGVANGSKLFHAGTERLSTELYGIDINGTLGADQINCSGVSTITVPANTNPHSSWDVVNNSASSYRFTGPGQDGAEDNPDIYLVRGQRYVFKMNASGHPFQIRVANGGAAYSDGVTNNGAQTGNVVFNVQHDAPAQLYYQCTSHSGMVGNIYIVGGPQVISGVVTATTFSGNLSGGTVSGTTGTFTNNLSVAQNIVHIGDTDTKIEFLTDTIALETAGSERLRIDSDGDIIIGSGGSWQYKKPLNVQGSSGSILSLYNADTTTYAADTNSSIELKLLTGNTGNQFGSLEIRGIKENGTNGNNARALTFYTGTNGGSNTERLRISSTGAVTKPAQPCAVVYQCTGPAGGAANDANDNQEPLHFDHVHINQGGMTISQNNGRIEVPVTGIYFVSYMISGTVSNIDTNDGIELILLVNGNEYPATNSGAEPVFNFGGASGEEFFANNTLLVSLTGGDYVEVAVDNIGNADANISRGNFSIMLMA